jgi:hypothetical protein
LVGSGLTRFADYCSFLLIYLNALQDINLVNVLYLCFFVVFLIRRNHARMWPWLIVFVCASLLARYLYVCSVAAGIAGDSLQEEDSIPSLLGLGVRSRWSLEVWYEVALLLCTAFFLRFSSLHRQAGPFASKLHAQAWAASASTATTSSSSSTPSDAAAKSVTAPTERADSMEQVLADTATDTAHHPAVRGIYVLVWVAVIVVAALQEFDDLVYPVRVCNAAYLVILFVFITTHLAAPRAWFITVSWTMATSSLYAGVVLFLQYAVQLERPGTLGLGVLTSTTLRSLGFVSTAVMRANGDKRSLFALLAPHTAVLIVSVLTQRAFRLRKEEQLFAAGYRNYQTSVEQKRRTAKRQKRQQRRVKRDKRSEAALALGGASTASTVIIDVAATNAATFGVGHYLKSTKHQKSTTSQDPPPPPPSVPAPIAPSETSAAAHSNFKSIPRSQHTAMPSSPNTVAAAADAALDELPAAFRAFHLVSAVDASPLDRFDDLTTYFFMRASVASSHRARVAWRWLGAVTALLVTAVILHARKVLCFVLWAVALYDASIFGAWYAALALACLLVPAARVKGIILSTMSAAIIISGALYAFQFESVYNGMFGVRADEGSSRNAFGVSDDTGATVAYALGLDLVRRDFFRLQLNTTLADANAAATTLPGSSPLLNTTFSDAAELSPSLFSTIDAQTRTFVGIMWRPLTVLLFATLYGLSLHWTDEARTAADAAAARDAAAKQTATEKAATEPAGIGESDSVVIDVVDVDLTIDNDFGHNKTDDAVTALDSLADAVKRKRRWQLVRANLLPLTQAKKAKTAKKKTTSTRLLFDDASGETAAPPSRSLSSHTADAAVSSFAPAALLRSMTHSSTTGATADDASDAAISFLRRAATADESAASKSTLEPSSTSSSPSKVSGWNKLTAKVASRVHEQTSAAKKEAESPTKKSSALEKFMTAVNTLTSPSEPDVVDAKSGTEGTDGGGGGGDASDSFLSMLLAEVSDREVAAETAAATGDATAATVDGGGGAGLTIVSEEDADGDADCDGSDDVGSDKTASVATAGDGGGGTARVSDTATAVAVDVGVGKGDAAATTSLPLATTTADSDAVASGVSSGAHVSTEANTTSYNRSDDRDAHATADSVDVPKSTPLTRAATPLSRVQRTSRPPTSTQASPLKATLSTPASPQLKPQTKPQAKTNANANAPTISLHERALGIVASFFHCHGFQVVQLTFLFVLCSGASVSIKGVFYIAALAHMTVVPRVTHARRWWVTCTCMTLLVLLQYLIGVANRYYRIVDDEDQRRVSSVATRWLYYFTIQNGTSTTPLEIEQDVVLWAMCVLHFHQLSRGDAAAAAVAAPTRTAEATHTASGDSTKAKANANDVVVQAEEVQCQNFMNERTAASWVRYFIFRWFYYLNLVAVFAITSTFINVLSAMYAVFALYLIRVGENVLHGNERDVKVFRHARIYAFIVLSIRVCAQVPIAYFRDAHQSGGGFFGSGDSATRLVGDGTDDDVDPRTHYSILDVLGILPMSASSYSSPHRAAALNMLVIDVIVCILLGLQHLILKRPEMRVVRRAFKSKEHSRVRRGVAIVAAFYAGQQREMEALRRDNYLRHQRLSSLRALRMQRRTDGARKFVTDDVDEEKEREKENAKQAAKESTTGAKDGDDKTAGDDSEKGKASAVEPTDFDDDESDDDEQPSIAMKATLVVISAFTWLYLHIKSVATVVHRTFSAKVSTKGFAWLVYFMFFVSFFLEPGLLQALPLVLIFAFGLIVSPRPPRTFWTFLIVYVELVIIMQYIIQFSVFCVCVDERGNKYFNICDTGTAASCPAVSSGSWLLNVNADDFFGLHKFDDLYGIDRTNESGEPLAFFRGIVANVVLLLTLFVHRMWLVDRGLWFSRNHHEIDDVVTKVQSKLYELEREKERAKRERSFTNRLERQKSERNDVTRDNPDIIDDGDDYDDAASRSESSTFGLKVGRRMFAASKKATKSILRLLRFHRAPAQKLNADDIGTEVKARAASDGGGDAESSEPAKRVAKTRWYRFSHTMQRLWASVCDNEKVKPGRDYYVLIFFTQFLQFWVVALLFQEGETTLATIQQNRISPAYVFAMLGQFGLIIVDRVIYLNHSTRSKFVLLLLMLVLFFVGSLVWGVQNSVFLRAYLFFQLPYFMLSSMQIKYGFSRYTKMQFLTHTANWITGMAFSVYRAIPFLFEIRTLLDWTCRDTTLFFNEWLKFEDIYASFFLAQCDIDFRQSEKRTMGKAQPTARKWYQGVVLVALLVLIVWGPLLIFATGAGTRPSPVRVATARVRLPGFTPLLDVGESGFPSIDNALYDELVDRFPAIRSPSTSRDDLFPVVPHSSAGSSWQITPSSRRNLADRLLGIDPIDSGNESERAAAAAAAAVYGSADAPLTVADIERMDAIKISLFFDFTFDRVVGMTKVEWSAKLSASQRLRLARVLVASGKSESDAIAASPSLADDDTVNDSAIKKDASDSDTSKSDKESESASTVPTQVQAESAIARARVRRMRVQSAPPTPPSAVPMRGVTRRVLQTPTVEGEGHVSNSTGVADTTGRNATVAIDTDVDDAAAVVVDTSTDAASDGDTDDAAATASGGVSGGGVVQDDVVVARLRIAGCWPRFVVIDSDNKPSFLRTDEATLIDCELRLHRILTTSDSAAASASARAVALDWWEVVAVDASDAEQELMADAQSVFPPIYVFTFPEATESSLNYSLVGLYITVVFTIGRFLRIYVVGSSSRIIIDDVPDASYLIRLCEDVYTARLHHHLDLEEQLYTELINLLRSPEALIQCTGDYRHVWLDADGNELTGEDAAPLPALPPSATQRPEESTGAEQGTA